MSIPTLRELGPHDGAVLDAVFAGLSAQSRFRRFHAGVPRLLPAVREGLTAVDGVRHLAVAAFDADEPIGIARLITVAPGRAELAVEVVDAWHGRGVGSHLVRAVAALGAARGVTEVFADVLAENLRAQLLLASVFPDLGTDRDGPEITFTARLTDPRSVPVHTLSPSPAVGLAAEHRERLLTEAAEHRLAARRRRQLRLRERWAAATPASGRGVA